MAKAAAKKKSSSKGKGPVKVKNNKEKKEVAKSKTKAKGKSKSKGKAKKAKKFELVNKSREEFITPVGRFAYLHHLKPQENSQFDKEKLTATVMWTDEEFTEKHKDGKKTWTVQKRVEDVLLKVARKAYDDKKITLEDFDHPLKYGNADEEKVNILKDMWHITAKIEFEGDTDPQFLDRKTNELSEKAIKKLKPGDWGRIGGPVYAYFKGTGGISFIFHILQLKESGEALTGGVEATAALVDELDVELDDPEDEEEESEEEESEDEEDDEDSEEDEEEDEEDEEDEDDEDDEDDDDDDDDEDDDDEDEAYEQ